MRCFATGHDTHEGRPVLGRKDLHLRQGLRLARLRYFARGSVGKNIGYGYVRSGNGVSDEYLYGGAYEHEVADKRVPCKLQSGPLYDPEMKRVKS